MNYTVAPFELADVKAPCTWSPYVDMFNVWRECLSFDLPLLDDLFSEYLFAKFQSYRDKVYRSGITYLHFNQYFMTRGMYKQYSFEEFIQTGKLKKYTYEQYVSANPNITLYTVYKHPDFAWDYNQLHCFLGENNVHYSEMKERLRQSRFWKRRYAEWSQCLSDGSTLLDLCYNKYLEVVYFIENEHIFRQILDSKFFDVFCQNPNVTWDFLKTRVTYDGNIPLKKRITTLINHCVRWHDILEFCGANDLFLPSDFWVDTETIIRPNRWWTFKKGDEFTHIYANYPYLLDYKKLRKHVGCDIISALVQKPDVPEEVVMSLKRQFDVQFRCVGDDFDLCDTKCTFRQKNNIMPIYLNVNLRDEIKMSGFLDEHRFSCENSKSLIHKRRREYTSCYLDRPYFGYRIGYSKNINLRLKDIDDTKLQHLDIMLFQNPIPLEKVAFLTEVLEPAAIKIQRWYLKHFYRPEGRYVNTVLRNRFNARL
ncbi:ORF65 [Xestia c-nigrum granulovirus]|uniref:ORF65 n=1 Tax=Xestia c-nigrum granulosis virus TaxID=51677 RepID=Q9PYX8_GVXN|nr:ORF65 [Xestia c-nigrum granulovirus]AAF05179.1 ORF65 [Xestia c-nigrum granulovirus]